MLFDISAMLSVRFSPCKVLSAVMRIPIAVPILNVLIHFAVQKRSYVFAFFDSILQRMLRRRYSLGMNLSLTNPPSAKALSAKGTVT